MEHVIASGAEVPALGFGTARMDSDDECREAVSIALDAGYRHVDTAQLYETERAVGDAIRESDVPRDEVFVTTKLHEDNRAYVDVLESTRESLDRLGTEYVDLLLIHSPNDRVPHEDTLLAMNELRDDGLVEHIGVSNFSVGQLKKARRLSDAPIVANQVEYNVYTSQKPLLSYCVEHDVMLTAYSPLAIGDALDEDVLAAIGRRHDKTPAQVALRWLIQQPMVSAIPMSKRERHIRENFDVFDFELTDEEMRALSELERGLSDRLTGLLGL